MLTELLKKQGIQKKELAAALTQRNGRPFSAALISRLLNKNELPKSTPPESIRRQMTNFLSTRGVDVEEINQAWFGLQPESNASEKDDMAKPILTQVARHAIGLLNGRELFEFDVQSGDDLYLTNDMRYLRAHLRDTALRGGFIAIIAEPGGGKTTIANDLEDVVTKENRDVRFIRPDAITVERLTASGIYDAIIDDVSEGTERPKRTLEYKARQARRLIQEAHKEGKRHVILIEEAQGLVAHTLKSLKRFWELKIGHENLLGIVLIGQTELNRHLQNESWNTREVALRCQVLELNPLTSNETHDYLQLKFSRVNLDIDNIFEPDCYAALHARLQDGQVSFAYPQRINNLVVRVLNKFAEVGGLTKVPAELVGGDLRLMGRL